MSNKRVLQDATNSPRAAKVPKTESETSAQLRALSREQARETLDRLIAGYTDKSGHGYPAATTNATDCMLVGKAPNRSVSTSIIFFFF